MGHIQKSAFRTMILSYLGIILGYLNKGFLFLIILSTEQIGLINLILSIGLLFAQFANLGTVYTTWKFTPFFKNEEKKHHGFFSLMFIIVLIGIVLCTIAMIVFKTEIEALYRKNSALFIEYYWWILPIGVSYVLFMLFEVFLRSFFKNIITVFVQEIVLRLALTALLGLMYLKFISFNSFVILHSIIYVLPFSILFIYLYKINQLNLRPSTINISKKFKTILIRFSAFNYVNTLGIVLINSLDVMMIAQMLGLTLTGVYSTVIFLTSALQVPYKSITRISAVLVSEYGKHREIDKLKELYTKVSSVSLVIGLGIFLCIWVNIEFIFSFLKPEFQEGIWVFFWLMIGRLLDMYFGLNGSIFTMSKKYKYDIYFTLFLIVAVFSLNLVFIPLWGIVGAAISTTIALVIYNIGRVTFVWYIFHLHPFERKQFIVILLGAVSLFATHFTAQLFDDKWIKFFFQLVVIGILFFAPIYIFRLEEEIVNYINKGIVFVKERVKAKLLKKR
jgi:O-antigen/teichoic acid export membrane protein